MSVINAAPPPRALRSLGQPNARPALLALLLLTTACILISDEQLEARLDADGDSYLTDASVQGDDCDDTDASVHPNAHDLCGDEKDQNCDGRLPECRTTGTLDASDSAAVYSDAGPNIGGSARLGFAVGSGGELAATWGSKPLMAITVPGADKDAASGTNQGAVLFVAIADDAAGKTAWLGEQALDEQVGGPTRAVLYLGEDWSETGWLYAATEGGILIGAGRYKNAGPEVGLVCYIMYDEVEPDTATELTDRSALCVHGESTELPIGTDRVQEQTAGGAAILRASEATLLAIGAPADSDDPEQASKVYLQSVPETGGAVEAAEKTPVSVADASELVIEGLEHGDLFGDRSLEADLCGDGGYATLISSPGLPVQGLEGRVQVWTDNLTQSADLSVTLGEVDARFGRGLVGAGNRTKMASRTCWSARRPRASRWPG